MVKKLLSKPDSLKNAVKRFEFKTMKFKELNKKRKEQKKLPTWQERNLDIDYISKLEEQNVDWR